MVAPLAVSLGDPAGIGPEVIAKSWERRQEDQASAFLRGRQRRRACARSGTGRSSRSSDPQDAVAAFDEAPPVIRVKSGTVVAPGQPDLDGARNSLDALELAVGLTRSGAASGLVTGPVSKAQLYAIGFIHPGQTEFVAERCGVGADWSR